MGDGCNMGAEMRKARRTDIDVTVSLNQLGVNAADRIQNKADVHVVDISKGGIAFKSGYDFKVNSFYDTVITLANGEKLYGPAEEVPSACGKKGNPSMSKR